MKAAKTTPTKKFLSTHPNGLQKEVGHLDSKSGLRVGPWTRFNEYGRLEERGTYKAGKKSGSWTEVDWKRGIVFTVKYKNGAVQTRAHNKFLNDKNLSDLDSLIESFQNTFQHLMRIAPTNIGEC